MNKNSNKKHERLSFRRETVRALTADLDRVAGGNLCSQVATTVTTGANTQNRAGCTGTVVGTNGATCISCGCPPM